MSVTMLGLPRSAGPARQNRSQDKRLADTFGRVATDLRVSVTDRCNLRCRYCMPAEGLSWLSSSDSLTTAELQRLVRIAVTELGIEHIRFTGGEPLLRKDLGTIIEFASALSPRPELSITTNGLGLQHSARKLRAAGLDRVNVSLDSVDQPTFAALTRRDRLDDVLAGLRAAHKAGLGPIKVNSVLQRGVNDDQACDLLAFCIRQGYELRFIEQMPLDAGRDWRQETMVTAAEILSRLSQRYDLTPDEQPRGNAPARLWRVNGGPATVGIIASVSAPFCSTCDRVRLTADGQLRNCLFATAETDIRALLRGGSSDEEIADTWRDVMWDKASGHGIGTSGFSQPDRPMSAIGG